VNYSSRLRHIEFIVLLGAVTAFAPMSIDMYLPALPVLGDEFGASPGHVQLTVASFFLGLAVGQGFYGPLSDRVRPKTSALYRTDHFHSRVDGLCAVAFNPFSDRHAVLSGSRRMLGAGHFESGGAGYV
jgi:MFS family permease